MKLPDGHGLGTGNWVCGLFRILPPFLSFHWAIPPPLTPHSLGTEDARGKDTPISIFTLKARKLRVRGGAFPRDSALSRNPGEESARGQRAGFLCP